MTLLTGLGRFYSYSRSSKYRLESSPTITKPVSSAERSAEERFNPYKSFKSASGD